MRAIILFLASAALFLPGKLYSQSSTKDSRFSLSGVIAGKDTGTIVLWHFGNDNRTSADTLALSSGRFHYTGTVNRACEALLWTNLKNRDFDDLSVIRFLLQPGNLFLSYDTKDPLHPVIKGSKAQAEKEDWDKHKISLITEKKKDQLNRLQRSRDSVNQLITAMDVKYIELHPNSYLSAYLLSQHTRKLPIDSTEKLYSALSSDVKASSVGHVVLLYVYKQTDDQAFRNANPLIDTNFSQRLARINSVYDLSFRDSAGALVKLNSLKAKYLVIDFWASWCKPCIQNIPALNRLIGHYKGDSIQFMSISLDYDLRDWRRALVKYRSAGVQLSDSIGYTGIAAEYCKVEALPTYIIADRNGRIINYNAPQALDPELNKLLRHLLSKRMP